MDFKKSILFIAFSIVIPSVLPTASTIRDAPSPSPEAYAPVTFHIVSHDEAATAAGVPAPGNDKKKPTKKGALGAEINPGLRDICQATKTPNKCTDYLAPIAVSAGGTYKDPISILNMEIALLFKQVEKASKEADQIGKKKTTPADVAKGLSACVEDYHRASDQLAKALSELTAKDAATMEKMLTSVAAEVKGCDAGFAGKKDAPMAKTNVKLIEMAELGIEISQKWLKKAN
ncbi:hypothetical protein LINPERPRIM_LOCUS3350 [Linum perenne]